MVTPLTTSIAHSLTAKFFVTFSGRGVSYSLSEDSTSNRSNPAVADVLRGSDYGVHDS